MNINAQTQKCLIIYFYNDNKLLFNFGLKIVFSGTKAWAGFESLTVHRH